MSPEACEKIAPVGQLDSDIQGESKGVDKNLEDDQGHLVEQLLS